MDISSLQALRQACPRILVVGDIMLDRYTWGIAERVSPEAPVVVLLADQEEVRLGGAASVASLLRGLGAEVEIAGVIGLDSGGSVVTKLFDELKIGSALVQKELMRPTTVKERFLGKPENRVSGQLLRVDRESRKPVSAEIESRVYQSIATQLSLYDAILISDYGKGLCTPFLLQSLIARSNALGIPVLVDPERRANVNKYHNSLVLKPNRAAAETITGVPIHTVEEALSATEKIVSLLQVSSVVLTLDRDGMVWRNGQGECGHVRQSSRCLRDITGAGDMAHAMLGFCAASGIPFVDSVALANLAAGVEVERDGVENVTWQDIMESFPATCVTKKVVSREKLVALVRQHRSERKCVVFTNGCFDLLHVGHITYLQEARILGDVLVVAINADDTVKALKGMGRPVVCERDRAAMVAALQCVDYVIIFEENTPDELLALLQPDVLVKGGTYSEEEVVGREVVQRYGGLVRTVGRVDGVSTSRLIRQITDHQHH